MRGAVSGWEEARPAYSERVIHKRVEKVTIKYVCISDIHAGVSTSLATHIIPEEDYRPDYGSSSHVATAFGKAFRAFLRAHNAGSAAIKADYIPKADERPQLILMGDVLDLAFCKRDDATEASIAFLRGMLFDQRAKSGEHLLNKNVIFLPGNHDHALWTAARMVNEAKTTLEAKDAADLPKYLDATKAFLAATEAEQDRERIPSPLMDAIISQAGFAGKTDLRYPNFALDAPELDRSLIFHHGHFIESTYRIMSTLQNTLMGVNRQSLTVEQLSRENANFIDFAFSSLGNASSLGRDAEFMFQSLLSGNALQRVKSRASRAMERYITEKIPMGGDMSVQQIVRMLIVLLMDANLGAYADQERYGQTEYLSEDSINSLIWYIADPTRMQIEAERDRTARDTSFIFGHTHKPFEDQIVADGYDLPVNVYNTGGWILDGMRLDTKEGASMVLIDEYLNVVSVRLFGVPTNGKMVPAYATNMSRTDHHAGDFLAEVQGLLEQTKDHWDRLTEVAHEEYLVRQQVILREIEKDDLLGRTEGAVV